MAKLVDALPSGGSVRKDVQVRILFWAQTSLIKQGGFLFYGVGKDVYRFVSGFWAQSLYDKTGRLFSKVFSYQLNPKGFCKP
jgi:hypothetical protein